MFQNTERFFNLWMHAAYRVKKGFDLAGVREDIIELEKLVRTERQAEQLDEIIKAASYAFGISEDELGHE